MRTIGELSIKKCKGNQMNTIISFLLIVSVLSTFVPGQTPDNYFPHALENKCDYLMYDPTSSRINTDNIFAWIDDNDCNSYQKYQIQSALFDTTDYFPLHVGDSFSYASVDRCPPFAPTNYYPGFRRHKVIDSIRIDNKLYFILDHFYNAPDTMRRDISGSVYLYTYGRDQLIYDMNAIPGGQWEFSLYTKSGVRQQFIGTMISNNDVIRTKSGGSLVCKQFHFQWEGTRYEFFDWLAPDIGLVFRCIDESIQLDSAIINGRVYPIINQMDLLRDECLAFYIYPNIIHSSYFNIRITSDIADYIELSIYTLTGSLVRHIYKGIISGKHTFMIHANDISSYDEGLYFVSLKSTVRTAVKKLIMHK